MIRFFTLAFIAATLTAQTPTVLSKVTIRTVSCEITETASRDGIAYSCSQVAADGVTVNPVARGTLIPVTASVTTTVTTLTPSATAGNPPDQSTFVITANRAGVGVAGTNIISWGISSNGVIQ